MSDLACWRLSGDRYVIRSHGTEISLSGDELDELFGHISTVRFGQMMSSTGLAYERMERESLVSEYQDRKPNLRAVLAGLRPKVEVRRVR